MTDTAINLDWASPHMRRILGRLLDGGELSVADGLRLAEVSGRDFQALTLVADEMRRRQAGDVVTYVVNRNINFTNVCIKHCTFCAFSRDHRAEQGYLLPMPEVVRRAREGAFTIQQRDRILAALVRDVPALAMVEMTPEITSDARTLLLRYPLRAGDAIQLASCLYLQRRLARPVPFVAFDERLVKAAREEGLTVVTPRERQPSTPARQDRSSAQ